jgi:serine/threonine-protein kinase
MPTGWTELRVYQLDDLARGMTQRWTSPFPEILRVAWTPRGRSLALSIREPRLALHVSVPFGSIDTLAHDILVSGFTPDGARAVGSSVMGADRELVAMSMDSHATPTTIAARPGDQIDAQLSPDGKWMAYTSNETGRWELFLEPFPFTGERKKISLVGGEDPRWSPQGDRIYYRYRDTFYVVPFDLRTGTAGQARPFVRGPFLNVPGLSHDVSRDGRRLLLILGPPEQTANHVRFISGFDAHVSRMLNR